MTKPLEFRRRAAFRLVGDVQIIGARIMELRKRIPAKQLPHAIVDDARDPASPFHRNFEWDDSVAAHEHRLEQARLLIRSVNIVIIGAGGHKVETRAFEFVTMGEGDGYTSIIDILSDKELYADLLERAKKELGHFIRRYDELAELNGVIRAARKLLRDQ